MGAFLSHKEFSDPSNFHVGWRAGFWSVAVLTCCLGATAWAKPLVFHYQQSAKAGDVVYIQGANLAGAKVYHSRFPELGPLQVLTTYQSSALTVQLPSSLTGQISVYLETSDGKSDVLYLNKARPYNMDATLIAPGAPFRVFGKNLMLAGSSPVVMINGQNASINISASTEFMLVGTAPSGLTPGAAAVTVDNGNGSGATMMLGSASVIAGSNADPFGLGVGWGSGFSRIASVIIDPTTNPNVTPRMVGNGVADNVDALQSAINYASSIGGGTILIPSGVYVLAKVKTPVFLKSNVVIKGAGKGKTILLHTNQTYPNYPLYSANNDLVGLSDFSLKTTVSDHTVLWNNNTRSFFKRISVVLGAPQTDHMFTTGNVNFAVEDNDFNQAALGRTLHEADACTGLVLTGNTYNFVAGGAVAIAATEDSYIAQNSFIWDPVLIKSAAPGAPNTITHGIPIDFIKRVTINSNSFQIRNGPVPSSLKWNDGEALLAEAGLVSRPGYNAKATSATATTLTDTTSNLKLTLFRGPTSYTVTILSGTGFGQTRHITGYANHTITVDQPWDVVPDVTSEYLTTIPIENTIISNNQLKQWPRGTWLYMSTVNRLDIINNTYTDGGGIMLRAESYEGHLDADLDTSVIMNVNMVGNKITNTTGNYGSYINVVYSNDNGSSPQGLGFIGIVAKNNSLIANKTNVLLYQEDLAFFEGYGNIMWYNYWMSGAQPYVAPITPGVLGTIFQGNSCANCSIPYRTGTNVFASVYVNTSLTNSGSGALLTQFLVPPGNKGSQGDYIH